MKTLKIGALALVILAGSNAQAGFGSTCKTAAITAGAYGYYGLTVAGSAVKSAPGKMASAAVSGGKYVWQTQYLTAYNNAVLNGTSYVRPYLKAPIYNGILNVLTLPVAFPKVTRTLVVAAAICGIYKLATRTTQEEVQDEDTTEKSNEIVVEDLA